ncbi:SctK family type III secretion system sorting platform protein [Horticoccus sp. 23ND18S-11]|uniref:SctK family type III secretion system sorting platform protein n=1 Tax=Horticoccus sp. 23ND18S-11 TaxID=3391832 RepID=UPI0039C9816C
MNPTPWLPSLLKDRPDLFRAIYDWNVYPHRWALPAWLEAVMLPAPVIALLEQSARGRERLSRHFRTALGLTDTSWEFAAPRRRLALLSAASLQQLASFSGAALHATRIAHAVTRDQRRALTTQIGEAAYDFALRQGRHHRGSSSWPWPETPTTDLGASVQHTGWKIVCDCVADEAPPLRRRFRLKVPREITFSDPAATAPEVAVVAWNFLQPITREALTREEQSCLA